MGGFFPAAKWLREDLHFRVTSIKADVGGGGRLTPRNQDAEKRAVLKARGWSIQRDEGRNGWRGGWGRLVLSLENKSRVHVQTSLPAAA